MNYDIAMTQKQDIFDLIGGKVRFYRGIYNPTADAVWLAAFAPSAKTVLDVGVGTGGVSICYMSHHPSARVTGIDISTDMLTEATRNAELNDHKLELINADIINMRMDRTFDLVMTNPPYFKGTPAKHNAHHNADIIKWTKKCIARVKPRGYFCTIVDAGAVADVIFAMNQTFGDITIFPLFGAKNTAERVLIRGRAGVRGGSVVYPGQKMNDPTILRAGLTIGV